MNIDIIMLVNLSILSIIAYDDLKNKTIKNEFVFPLLMINLFFVPHWSVLSIIILWIWSYLMYALKSFSGGDAKLVMALAPLCCFAYSSEPFQAIEFLTVLALVLLPTLMLSRVLNKHNVPLAPIFLVWIYVWWLI